MKIVVNTSMLGKRHTGLGVYSTHSSHAIENNFDATWVDSGDHSPIGKLNLRSPDYIAIGSGRFAAIRRQFWMRSVRFGADQLVYSPTHHGFPNVDGQIITIHDLICLRFPAQHRSQYLFFKYGLPKLMRKCRAVFCVSETTKQDVSKTYGFPADRIFVVPNGVDTSTFSADISAKDTDPYLLMVGARYSHKNVDEVLAFSDTWAKDYRLMVTSCSGVYREFLEKRVLQLGLKDRVHFCDYLSREELVRLYQGCSALLYPSKWEGFGIPPLEAMACGSPVIASDIPVHREVLGDAAIFVSLGNRSSWRDAFARLQTEGEVSALLGAGEGVLKRFTWENSGKQLVDSLLAVEPSLVRK